MYTFVSVLLLKNVFIYQKYAYFIVIQNSIVVKKIIIFFSIHLRMEIWFVFVWSQEKAVKNILAYVIALLLGLHQKVESLDAEVGMNSTLSETVKECRLGQVVMLEINFPTQVKRIIHKQHYISQQGAQQKLRPRLKTKNSG